MGRLGNLLEKCHGNRKREGDVGGNGVGIDTMHDLDRGGKIGRLDRLDRENEERKGAKGTSENES
jgi:hypothetical protein